MLEADAPEDFEKPSPQELAASFQKLLSSWHVLYEGHTCERSFLEFSSAIAFTEWEQTVKALKQELKRIVFLSSPAGSAAEGEI